MAAPVYRLPEHVHMLHRHSSRPTTNQQLLWAIQEEWDAITLEEIATITGSLSLRVLAVQAASGGHTKY